MNSLMLVRVVVVINLIVALIHIITTFYLQQFTDLPFDGYANFMEIKSYLI
jgi:hypothetical protein